MRYRPGQIEWEFSDPALPGLKAHLTGTTLADATGFTARLVVEGARPGDCAVWCFFPPDAEKGASFQARTDSRGYQLEREPTAPLSSVRGSLSADVLRWEQIAYADVLILNKIDLVDEAGIRNVRDALAFRNGDCRIVYARDAVVAPSEVLDIGGYDLKRIANGISGCSGAGLVHPKNEPAGHHHEIETVAVDVPGKLEPERFRDWLGEFVDAHAADLFRCKGIVALAGCPERLIFQGVHGMFRMTLGEPWGEVPPVSRAVFIGRHLDREAIAAAIADCGTVATPA